MKQKKLIYGLLISFCSFIAILFFISSCGMKIEKRRYNKGFHISTSANKNFNRTSKTKENSVAIEVVEKNPADFQVSNENQISNFNYIPYKSKEEINASEKLKSNEKHHFSNKNSKTVSDQSSATRMNRKHLAEKLSEKEKFSNPESSDKYLYLIAGLVALSSFSIIKGANSKMRKLARWGVNNKRTARTILIASQFGLAYVGFGLGGTLNEADYTFSTDTRYFPEILGLGSLIAVSFFKETIFGFFKQKIAYALIGVSLFTSAMSIGNGAGYNSTMISPIAFFVEQASEKEQTEKENYNEETDDVDPMYRSTKGYGAVIAVWIIFAILLTLIFAGLTCMTFCTYGSLGGFAVIASILLLGAFNWGMVAWRRKVLYGPRKKKSTSS